MRIISLEAENFKRLRAVEIRPDGDVVRITGENGAVKSSVLDAIWAGLGGRAVEPGEPIKQGEEAASIKLEIGGPDGVQYVVTRTWARPEVEGGPIRHTLKVETKGKRLFGPQEALNRLLGPMTLDPLEFVRTIAVARICMPASVVRLSAGRENMSEEMQALCFLAGANSIFYGPKLLTTPNPGRDSDMALLDKLGMRSMD